MNDSLTYKDAGVDIEAGNEAVKRIRNILSNSPRSVPGGEVIGGIGGFAGLFKPALQNYADPLLVSATDSVGTKILTAIEYDKLEWIGYDLVGMNVNDLLACGARPMFFLDYLGLHVANPVQIERIVKSVNDACIESECLLIGGECAEMPDMYEPGKTDLAGFAVGIVDREKVIHGKAVRAGDIVLGLASNGLHSNGFSLIRKLIVRENWDMNSKIDGDDRPLIDIILAPTRLYVKQIHALIDKVGINADGGVRALAHITGGGLIDNVPRSFPENFAWKVNLDGWTSPPIFKMIKKSARLPRCGLWETFNCGIGYTVIVGAEFADEAEKSLKDSGEKVYRLGEIIPASDEYGDNVVIDSKGLWD